MKWFLVVFICACCTVLYTGCQGIYDISWKTGKLMVGGERGKGGGR